MEIVVAVIVLAVISILCGAMLSVASKFMAVKVDERIPVVRACLPGANCGACGFAGCDGYAAALVNDPNLSVSLCTPGGSGAAAAIGEVLGRAAEEKEKMVAQVACSGDCDATTVKMDYRGIETCSAAKLLFGGGGSCLYGCLGLGDCAAVCPAGAIHNQNGIAAVNPDECIGCELCTKTCPNNLIHMRPASAFTVVRCSNKDKAPAVKKVCTNGCWGCRLCERNCPEKAIHVTDNVASVDYAACTGCGVCMQKCPSHCIYPVNVRALEEQTKATPELVEA